MPRLISYNKEVGSIFELLGDKENDITLSMSWALAKCPEFLKAVVSSVVPVMPDPEETVILNQQYTADTGITDIEVTDYRTFHVIFEAKRGWVLPGTEQLTKYSVRKDFAASGVVCFKRLLNQSVRKSLKTYKPTILGKERIANEKKGENHAIV